MLAASERFRWWSQILADLILSGNKSLTKPYPKFQLAIKISRRATAISPKTNFEVFNPTIR